MTERMRDMVGTAVAYCFIVPAMIIIMVATVAWMAVFKGYRKLKGMKREG